MKSKRKADKSVICPFYSEEEAQKIICEGLEPGTAVHLTFASPSLLREHKHKFCCKDSFKQCRLAQTLFKKYEEEK